MGCLQFSAMRYFRAFLFLSPFALRAKNLQFRYETLGIIGVFLLLYSGFNIVICKSTSLSYCIVSYDKLFFLLIQLNLLLQPSRVICQSNTAAYSNLHRHRLTAELGSRKSKFSLKSRLGYTEFMPFLAVP